MAILHLMYGKHEVSKVLVIAPLRVAKSTWPDELKKWDDVSHLRMSVVIGTARERKAALDKNADIYVINRDNVKWLTDFYGSSWPFDMVVIDELSSFKNHQSQRWKALNRIRHKISRMVGLTATPATNGYMDLFGEVGIIDGGERFGKFIGSFRTEFFYPASMNPYTGVVYSYNLRPEAEKKIFDRISDITISMKSTEYLEMPDLISVNHDVEMDSDEQAAYDTLKRDMVLQLTGGCIDAVNAAVLSGKLLQMANGAVYDDASRIIRIHDRKLDMLEDLVEQANGKSVLVAYWFRHDRERILERISSAREVRTDQDVKDWNSGKITVGLVSPASAGHGLNLQEGGHILIWFSQIWSLELSQQLTGRLWRQGQKETVTVHHIICKNTIDEDVTNAIAHKKLTQELLISAVKARLFTENA